jgi:hypothetical protein
MLQLLGFKNRVWTRWGGSMWSKPTNLTPARPNERIVASERGCGTSPRITAFGRLPLATNTMFAPPNYDAAFMKRDFGYVNRLSDFMAAPIEIRLSKHSG